MIRIFFVFLALSQTNSAIVESLQEPEKPIYPRKALIFLEEIKKYEKDMKQYEESLKKYKEELAQFWPKAENNAEQWWRDMPKWKESFDISNGNATVYHGENGIRIVSNLVSAFEDDDNNETSAYLKSSAEIYLPQWQGQTLKQPLRLKWHSSRNDFVIELIRSGLYKGTKSERAIYENSGNWHGHHTLVGLFFCDHRNARNRIACRSIEHTETGITLWDDKEDRIGSVCSSVELFGFDGRKIHLNHKQSYYEFMMRLIETGHVSFLQYPPYTIQGRSKIDHLGKEKIYYECYYYGDIPATENPLYRARELKKKMQKQERTRKQIEKQQKIAKEICSAAINSALSIFSTLATQQEKNTKMASQTLLTQNIQVIEDISTQRNDLLSRFLNGIRPALILASNPFKNFQRYK